MILSFMVTEKKIIFTSRLSANFLTKVMFDLSGQHYILTSHR